jgi:hypothetical protein
MMAAPVSFSRWFGAASDSRPILHRYRNNRASTE